MFRGGGSFPSIRGVKVIHAAILIVFILLSIPGLTSAQQKLTPGDMEKLPEAARKLIKEESGLLTDSTGEIEGKFGERRPEPSPDMADGMEEPSVEGKKYDWKKSKYVGKLFAPRFLEKELDPMVHFGHDIFEREEGKFAPLTTLPVSSDYIVGPGDEILITLWGRLEARYSATINREGKIYVPKFGTLYVAGKTYRELKEYIKERVSVVTGASVDVTVTKLKGIKIFVLGEVNSPGAFNVSSFHTAIQALYTAGGVKDTGSLRDIQVIRNEKVSKNIDIYRFIFEGNVSGDIQLLQGDTVFVPIVSKLVAISGEVRRQGIFELKGGESLRALLRMAGGFSPAAYKRRIQIERLEMNVSRIVLDVNAEELMSSDSDFPIEDGDIVRVMALFLEDVNAVVLDGNVYSPGKYELKEGMKVRDLLPDRFAFLPDTYFDYATLIRLIPPDMHREIIPLNLKKAILEGDDGANVSLKPFDRVIVYSRVDFVDLPLATISGEVRNPGAFEVKQGMRVSDIIRLGGDLKKTAYTEKGEIVRVMEDRTIYTLYFNVEKALGKDPASDLLLQDEDSVIIRSHPNAKEIIFVNVEGEVKFPGYYGVSKGEMLSSVIERAGGFKEEAYLKGAVFTRESVKKIQQERIDKLIDDLEHRIATETTEEIVGIIDPDDVKIQKELLAVRHSLLAKLKSVKAKGRIVIRLATLDEFKGSESDLVLEDGDELTVPKHMNIVNIIGEVYNPTAVTYDPEERKAGHYLDMVGGATNNADEKLIFVIKANGTVLSKKNVGNIKSAKLDPGDTIAVPEKILKTRIMKDIKDITQILFQIAVTTGVVIALF